MWTEDIEFIESLTCRPEISEYFLHGTKDGGALIELSGSERGTGLIIKLDW